MHALRFGDQIIDVVPPSGDAIRELAGSEPREDINKALGVGQHGNRYGNVEVKYTGPDGVTVDVSETGWVGTSGL